MPAHRFVHRLASASLLLAAALASARAANVGSSQLSTSPSNQCTPPAAVTSFRNSDLEIWAYFEVDNGLTGDVGRVDWIDPNGKVALSSTFSALPSSGSFCFDAPLSTLDTPYTPAVGSWSVRMVWNGTPLGSISFQIVQGVTITTAQLAHSASAGNSCTAPPAVAGFSTSDTEIWTFLLVDNAATNDYLDVAWIDPNGNQARSTISFNPVSAPGAWCFNAWLSKAGDLYAPVAGAWSVQFYWNSKLLDTLNFQITAPGGGGGGCSYTLNPNSASPTSDGGSGSFQVMASAGTCSWSAVASASFITFVPGFGSGTGSGTVKYNIASNQSTSSRPGSITIGNAIFTITQAGAPISGGGGGTPALTNALNAASYMPASLPGGAIAVGSIFTIFGTAGMGPAAGAQNTVYPIQPTLAGISIKVTQGSTSVNAFPIYVSEKQINAIMPSNTPLGQVQLTVSNGANVSNAITLTIAASNFGAFSATGSGQGPAAVLQFNSATDQPLNTLSNSATPGQVAILFGTGLGAVTGGDNVAPPVGNLPTAVQVLVGGKQAAVFYSGRAPGYAAEDQINFQIPIDVMSGCYVPVVVKTGASNYSNTVTMAIGAQGQRCAFTTAAGKVPTAGGSTASISLMRIDAVAPIDPSQPSSGILDVVSASFETFPAGGDFGFSPTSSQAAPGSCLAFTGVGVSVADILGGAAPSFLANAGGATELDAGSTLSITGPNGMMPVPRSDTSSSTGPYLSLVGGLIGPLFFSPGSYTVSGPGGTDIGAFQANITLASNPAWNNRDQINVIDRGAGVHFTWTGGDPSSQVVMIGGGSSDKASNTSGFFLCMANVADGQFTVPPSVLGNLPTTPNPATQDSLGILFLMDAPTTNPPTFSASGLTAGGYIVNQLMTLKTMPVQ